MKYPLKLIAFITAVLCCLYTTFRHPWCKMAHKEGSALELPEVYVITPTYPRATQLADLTRLAQALAGVPCLTWVLVEDTKRKTEKVKCLEACTGLRYTRGVAVFPVGLVGKFGLSSPVVGPREGGQVGGLAGALLQGLVVRAWYDSWDHGRKFMVDMAGFSVSTALYRNRSLAQGSAVMMPPRRGREEDDFLRQLGLEVEELEVMSPYEVLVWHTKTAGSPHPRKPGSKYQETNIEQLWQQV